MRKIKHKIILLILICVGITIAIQGSYSVYNLNKMAEKDIQDYRRTLYEQFDFMVKSQVETCISVIEQFHNRQLSGELTADQAQKMAADLVRELRFDNENYFWVDTVEGINVVLLGRDTEGVTRYEATDPDGVFYVKDFIANGTKEGGGYTDYRFTRPGGTELIPKRAYTLAFKPFGWVIGTGNYLDDIEAVVKVKEDAIRSSLQSNIFLMLIVVVLSIGISIFIGLFLSRSISNPIVNMANGVKLLSEGDLRVNQIKVRNKDEIGELASGFNTMAESLRNLVKRVMESSTQIASASEQLANGSEQLASAASSVAASISEVSAGTEKQIDSVQSVTGIVQDMDRSFNLIIQDVRDVTAVSNKTASTAQAESISIENTIKQMAAIETTTHKAAALVDNLGDRSREIGQIVSTISGIAEQTNLLALNAAIEAARAGEQGKGFAVVADEVRKLAEQSQSAAKQIAELIKHIQLDTQQAVTAMNEGTNEVKLGTQSVNTAGNTFKEIALLIDNVSKKITASTENLLTVSTESEAIAKAVEAVQKISGDIAAQTQSVNAAVQQQTASSEEMASSSHMLMKSAEEMQQLLSRFRI